MIPDLSGQRAAILAVVELVDVPVFPAAPDGTLPAQFVVIGMPSWRPPDAALCMATVDWPGMVCVARPGTSDTVTALALEGLWPQVLEVLDQAVEADPSLGGVCTYASLENAEFTTVTIQGRDFPAQIINLKLKGA